jgi:very-short-patch-repair endonuclease
MAEFNPALSARRARQLRKRTTDSEARLWAALRERHGGLKWRRQHSIPPFIVDFYNAERRVAVEVDGDVHEGGEEVERDARRDTMLRRLGVKVLRVPASAVSDRLDAVVTWITAKALREPEAGPRGRTVALGADRRACRRVDPSGASRHLPASGEGSPGSGRD